MKKAEKTTQSVGQNSSAKNEQLLKNFIRATDTRGIVKDSENKLLHGVIELLKQ